MVLAFSLLAGIILLILYENRAKRHCLRIITGIYDLIQLVKLDLIEKILKEAVNLVSISLFEEIKVSKGNIITH